MFKWSQTKGKRKMKIGMTMHPQNTQKWKIGGGNTHDRAQCTIYLEITDFTIFRHESFPGSNFDPKRTQIIHKHHHKITLTSKP